MADTLETNREGAGPGPRPQFLSANLLAAEACSAVKYVAFLDKSIPTGGEVFHSYHVDPGGRAERCGSTMNSVFIGSGVAVASLQCFRRLRARSMREVA